MRVFDTSRNNSIDFFRYIAAILVVALHTDVFVDISPLLSYLVAQVLSRIAVPFFFTVSGYYYLSKLRSRDKCAFWGYCKRLLKSYFSWSLIYFVGDMLGGRQIRIGTLLQGVFFTGIEYHLWFFPALIYAVMLVTWTYRKGWQRWLIPCSVVGYLIGCLGHSYYHFGQHIPGIGGLYNAGYWIHITNTVCIGFPFFVMGGLIQDTEEIWSCRNILRGLCGTMLMVYLCEVLFLKLMNWASTITICGSLYIVVYFLVMLMVKNPLPGKEYAAGKAKQIASFTFYSHILILAIVGWINEEILEKSLSETPIFLITICTTHILGWLIGESKSKVAKVFIS